VHSKRERTKTWDRGKRLRGRDYLHVEFLEGARNGAGVQPYVYTRGKTSDRFYGKGKEGGALVWGRERMDSCLKEALTQGPKTQVKKNLKMTGS